MMKLAGRLLLLTTIALPSCSSQDSEQKSARQELYQATSSTLEKAKGVEQEVERGAEHRSQEIDRQTEQ